MERKKEVAQKEMGQKDSEIKMLKNEIEKKKTELISYKERLLNNESINNDPYNKINKDIGIIASKIERMYSLMLNIVKKI